MSGQKLGETESDLAEADHCRVVRRCVAVVCAVDRVRSARLDWTRGCSVGRDAMDGLERREEEQLGDGVVPCPHHRQAGLRVPVMRGAVRTLEHGGKRRGRSY